MKPGHKTVTVYRKTPEGVRRWCLTGCHYTHTARSVRHERYARMERQCLLVAPGQQDLRPGDRVLEGIGPEQVDWDRFLPVTVPTLTELSWVRVYALPGESHTEAGR